MSVFLPAASHVSLKKRDNCKDEAMKHKSRDEENIFTSALSMTVALFQDRVFSLISVLISIIRADGKRHALFLLSCGMIVKVLLALFTSTTHNSRRDYGEV